MQPGAGCDTIRQSTGGQHASSHSHQAVPAAYKVVTLWPGIETSVDLFETAHDMWEYVRLLEAEGIAYFTMRCK